MLFVFTLPHIKTEQNHCSVAQKPCSLFSTKTETEQKLASVSIFLSWQPKSALVLLISTSRYVRIEYKYGGVVQKSNFNIFRDLRHQGFQSRSWKSMVFKRIFFLKIMRFWNITKSRKSGIPEPELDINGFQKKFSFKNYNILTPPEIKGIKNSRAGAGNQWSSKMFLFNCNILTPSEI